MGQNLVELTDWFEDDYPNIAKLADFKLNYDLNIDEPYLPPSPLYDFSIS